MLSGKQGLGLNRQAPFVKLCNMETLRVLLVEDDDSNRQLAHTRLSLLGYQVVPCASGAEALAMVEAGQPFDLALMDLRLPDMGGELVIDWLRNNHSTTHLPILIVSGDASGRTVPGADHFILKPYHLHQLVMAIGITMEKRQQAALA